MLIVANLPGLQKTAKKHQLIAEEHLDIAQKRSKTEDAERRRKREEKCLHLFRLTTSTVDVTYEWYKDRVQERVEGTCMWFLQHAHFLEWIKQDSGPLLVSADPGCGKSVLAKYMVDHVLPGSTTVCYFFFKDQDQNTVRQALCALLHQLISQKPALIQHAMKQYEKDGQGLTNSTKSLWTILQNAVQDKQAGSVIIVLDALDECLELEFEDLMRNIGSQSRNCQSSHSRLRYLMTSRPYEQIVAKFRGLFDSFPRIHIPGEEESEAISQEVNRVIKYRVERLTEEMRLTNEVKNYLTDRLIRTEHRTYLWVYLVFDNIKTEGFKKTKKGIEEATKSLPKSVNEAYERILAKSGDQVTVRRALAMILAASRPLTLSELNLALEVKETTRSTQDLDLEGEEDFKSRLRSWCGLFVSIHHGKVYFLHQTAREFLLADSLLSTPISQEVQWQHSIAMQDAHKVLAECCVRYLNLLNSDESLYADVTAETSDEETSDEGTSDEGTSDEETSDEEPSYKACAGHTALFEYSAQYWPIHFRESCFSSNKDAAISRLALKVSNPDSRSFSRWRKSHWHSELYQDPNEHLQLIVASLFGHDTVVQLLLDEDADVNAQGGRCRYSNALQAASAEGHKQVVKMLLNKGADVNAQNIHYGNALRAASAKGHEQVVKTLLDKGADVNAQNRRYGSSLHAASAEGYNQVVEMLLNKGADVNAQGERYGNALRAASAEGHEQVVKILLDKGADVNAQNRRYGSALHAASAGGYNQVVKILLNKGADVNVQGGDYGNALQAASAEGHEQVVKMLLNKGADVNAQGGEYGNALYAASAKGCLQVVEMLLNRDADVNAQGAQIYSSALEAASVRGHKQVVELLLSYGARDVEKTPLNPRRGPSWTLSDLLMSEIS
jgi:ankyrin repeat protein